MVENENKLIPLDAPGQPPGCKEPLFGLDSKALSARMVPLGQPSFRGKQLSEALYQQWVTEISEITTLPSVLRLHLASEGWQIGRPAIAQAFRSVDGTERYLIEFQGPTPKAETAEAVWMPEGDGGEAGDNSADDSKDWRRATICVSSQVGCAVNCQFCLTAKLGLQRNLTAGEIAGQVVAVLDRHRVRIGQDRVNLVFMGMGEPFLNYENFVKAARLLVECVGIAERRMTVSTAGVVPRIHDFGAEPIRPKLAISLNASNDALRTRLMPLNKKWNLEMLVAAARDFPLRTREWITFEYVLLGGVNDEPENAKEVAELLRGLRCKVNLIALNPGPGIDFTTPGEERVVAFQRTLRDAGIPAFVRRPRGRDIFAACGQLKRTIEVATSQERQLQGISPVPEG